MPQLAELCDFYIVDSGSIILSKERKMIHSIFFKPQLIPEIVAMMNNSPETPVPFYYTPVYEGADSRIDNVTKLRFWFSDSSQLDKISRNISEAFPVFAVYAANVTSRHKELKDRSCFIEIIPSESGKSRAIKILQETYHTPRETIITVGDGLNDLAMIQDFDGFVIAGSKLSNIHPELNTTPSFKDMVGKLLHG